ncbi:aldolase [Tersicoccus phoenicis]|uniref:Aldolase n=1 Tax=Tersicoccus phoenicis TaxID=554083 RepID=A0A1R1LJE2_9MICC|nr:aldolase/citrate lyase family protein [Tersicoccus phoenicis]OMH27665.1 aldolase [Tersicoccus phoenicis]
MAAEGATSAALTDSLYDEVDAALAATDTALAENYPGEDGRRQPVHTVYVPADRYDAGLPAAWGEQALALAAEHGGLAAVARLVGVDDDLADRIAPLVETKLRAEPIEDLRIDFEDGLGARPDDVEDEVAVAAARTLAGTVVDGTAPPFAGLRFKCLEASTRRRGLRTLDLFLGGLIDAGGSSLIDAGRLVITLPKVSTVDQVEAMVTVCEELERAHGLPTGRLRFEVQVETPPLILAADGTAPVATMLHRAGRRISALHYGTYDYSASLQIAAEYQSMEHPGADYAKEVMQVAVAGTGVTLSDGSTNVLPVGSPDAVHAAWQLHARLVTRSLQRGYYQGWDLHAAQLPTRYIATYAFYRRGFDAAATRLRNYVTGTASAILDEPATARALAKFIDRGYACGALAEDEVRAACGLDPATVAAISRPHSNTRPAL